MTNTGNKNKFLLLALLSTLVAIGIHIYLTQHFYQVKFGLGEGGSVCNINEVLNCDAVTASRFSSFLGLPIALWGVATNLILLCFLGLTRYNLTQDRAKTSRYAFILSALTVIASVVMGTISLTAMKNLCIFCITAYFLSIVGFVTTWLGAEKVNLRNISDDIKDLFVTDRWALGYFIAVPVIAFLANLMYLESHGLSDIEKIANDKVIYWQSSPQQNFDLTTGLSLQAGNSEPIMTIVEFADFRCPHCKHAVPSLHAFTNSHPDVKLIFKPFPLDGTCNDAIKGGGDGISCGLAIAVMCAEQINKSGWKAHNYFFDNQMDIIQAQNLEKNLEAVSPVIGITKEDLKKCVEGPEVKAMVIKMANEGAAAQIQGTPTVFVNGRVLNGGQLLPVLDAAYKSLKK
ncbi:vitamin K epoxide reductase/DsbA family protein [Bdellovibrio svalbardensis]|uniref:Thioredoxin domain-containing protein n=1 Tax=Bdellovibrio svalbardensis TaxID=2972972 RepID=A0ABT6DL18_9BACT|nr:thioredoxin domain-containing protein [Bdellovibrio svalbardensis]MDG0816526.1 thioredoxin domain-containing protein [Bdellovibrio svalbardensis]